jgi:double-stranded uracil-DNA glycosylase
VPRSAKKPHILPDRLGANLRVWFVGTAAGPRSAAVGAYYAHPGNRFWRALHDARITPHLYDPHDYPQLLDLRIGLTDFCKISWGVDASIDRAHFDVEGFRRKVRRLRPRALAFTSKAAASLWLARSTGRIEAGLQPETADPAVFVLPSPSGLATSYWSIAPWKQLAAWLEANEEKMRLQSKTD